MSGGGDSAALLEAAADWARASGRRIEAATVDHRLRPEAAAEARAVAARCAVLGVPHEILVWSDPPAHGGNLSARAREARLGLLAEWAARRDLAAVALGHTLDDQAETVLMRLARGSAADGLSGMAAARRARGTLWLRPMLGLRREALRDMLRARGLGWIDDPTNDDPDYDRVRARRALATLATLGLDAEGIAATADRLRGQREVLEDAAAALAAKARRWGAAGEARIDRAAYAAARADTRYRLLAATLAVFSGPGFRPRQAALEAADAAIRQGGPGRALRSCLILPAGDAAVICREPKALPPPVPAGQVWAGRWRAEGAPADAVLGALGEDGLAALKAAAAEGWRPPEGWRAAPRAARMGAPALRRGGSLLAVSGANYGLDAQDMRRLRISDLALAAAAGDGEGRPRRPAR